jgi:CubicO group peptidase (beta-lactamase class C family)
LEHSPLQAAMLEQHLFPNPLTPPLSGDEFVARLAALPIAFQPGDGWLYDTGTDVLGVLLTRATGKPLSDLIAERVTGPLGMASTSFWTDDPGRLATGHDQPAGRVRRLLGRGSRRRLSHAQAAPAEQCPRETATSRSSPCPHSRKPANPPGCRQLSRLRPRRRQRIGRRFPGGFDRRV